MGLAVSRAGSRRRRGNERSSTPRGRSVFEDTSPRWYQLGNNGDGAGLSAASSSTRDTHKISIRATIARRRSISRLRRAATCRRRAGITVLGRSLAGNSVSWHADADHGSADIDALVHRHRILAPSRTANAASIRRVHRSRRTPIPGDVAWPRSAGVSVLTARTSDERTRHRVPHPSRCFVGRARLLRTEAYIGETRAALFAMGPDSAPSRRIRLSSPSAAQRNAADVPEGKRRTSLRNVGQQVVDGIPHCHATPNQDHEFQRNQRETNLSEFIFSSVLAIPLIQFLANTEVMPAARFIRMGVQCY